MKTLSILSSSFLLTALVPAQVSFGAASPVSVEGNGGAVPGKSAIKAKLVRLVKTKDGKRDGRLVTAYADADHTGKVWTPKSGEYLARDIFVRWSDDGGKTWSKPVNVSRTADKYSLQTDWSGDGNKTPYWGDSGKATVFNNGDTVVITWYDKYAPEATWTWGDKRDSAIQGSIGYADPQTFPNKRFIPFACMYAAISYDGGATWPYGVAKPPLQLTYGRRDAIQNVVKGNGPRWAVTWQEDPEGLQKGEAEGPGEGYSGAKVTKGTDIWYTWTPDIKVSPEALRANRTPLSDHSKYDATGTNGYPVAGKPGSNSTHGASRANMHMLKVGTSFQVIVAYEETKGLPDLERGKTIQYHAFPFDKPVQNGAVGTRYGDTGTLLSEPRENGRRVRFVAQGTTGTVPAIAIFWKQGLRAKGAPSDIMCRVSMSIAPATVAASKLVNLSSETPKATAANLLDKSGTNPYEDARAHRAWIRDGFLVVGWSYTPNGPVARYTDLANYNFWIRRTFDGGKTWLPPQNLSQITDTKVNVLEPRLVGPARTGKQDDNSFLVAWGTETNVYEGIEESEQLDVFATRTRDRGNTWELVLPLAMTGAPEFESQLRIDDKVDNVYAVWMRKGAAEQDALFARGGHPLWVGVHPNPIDVGKVGQITFVAPGYTGKPYLGLASFSTSPGIRTPWGTVPLTLDALTFLSVQAPQAFVGFAGVVGSNGTAPGWLVLPDDPSLSGLEFWIGFVTLEQWGISNPTLVRYR